MSAATPLTSVEPPPKESGASASAYAEGQALFVHSSRLSGPLVAVLTAFWTYVAASNLLYAHSMSVYTDPKNHFFAGWDARVLQHLVLYPVLLGCVWLSLRVGWRPLARAIPIQLALGLGFAALATPVLGSCEWLVGEDADHHGPWSAAGLGASFAINHDLPTWIAGATSFLLTYGFALALVTGFALYRRFKESELRRVALERAWSGARLAALRMQLSPHTLFNLLHTIRGQIAWDPAAARQMVVQLGDLLRRLLAAGERDLSPLTEELEFARLYLELQRQRFADRLSLELPETGTLPQTWVPSLILQPLVENAVAHGLADHGGPVVIRIESEIEAQMLRLSVTNTMSPSRSGSGGPLEGHRSSSGIGLRNVRERLAVHFGNRAALETGTRVQRHADGSDTAGTAAGSEHGRAAAQWVAEIRMPLVTAIS